MLFIAIEIQGINPAEMNKNRFATYLRLAEIQDTCKDYRILAEMQTFSYPVISLIVNTNTPVQKTMCFFIH